LLVSFEFYTCGFSMSLCSKYNINRILFLNHIVFILYPSLSFVETNNAVVVSICMVFTLQKSQGADPGGRAV